MDFKDMILVTPTDPETDVIIAFHDYSEYSQRDISNTNLGQINIGNTKQVWLRVFETERMNIRWYGCYGTQYDNTYGSLSVFGNKIYLLYSSSTSTFGSTSQDMLLTIINLRTGVEVSTKIYGSTSDESTLDIVVNHFGIFIMANIGNGFKLNGATDSYSTQNSNTNFNNWSMLIILEILLKSKVMIRQVLQIASVQTIQRNLLSPGKISKILFIHL